MKGIIALDIDGTIATSQDSLEKEVVGTLDTLAEKGWELLFLTGRSVAGAMKVLRFLKTPFALGAYNGALLLSMPDETILKRHYLAKGEIIPLIDLCDAGITLYGGYEHRDVTYYVISDFSSVELAYLEERRKAFKEEWIAVDSLSDAPLESFPSIKAFGTRELLQSSIDLFTQKGYTVPCIVDPFDSSFVVVQITHHKANKGAALRWFRRRSGENLKVIAAGDDANDLSMFSEATLSIAAPGAQPEVRSAADVVAERSLVETLLDLA